MNEISPSFLVRPVSPPPGPGQVKSATFRPQAPPSTSLATPTATPPPPSPAAVLPDEGGGMALIHVVSSGPVPEILGRTSLSVRVTLGSHAADPRPMTSTTDAVRAASVGSGCVWNRELWYPNGSLTAMPVELELLAGKGLLSAGKAIGRAQWTPPSGTSSDELCRGLTVRVDLQPVSGGRIELPAPLALYLTVKRVAAASALPASHSANAALSDLARPLPQSNSAGFHRQNKFRCVLRKNWFRPGETLEAVVEYAPRHTKVVPSVRIAVVGRLELRLDDGRTEVHSLLAHEYVYDGKAANQPGASCTSRGELQLDPGSYTFSTTLDIPADALAGPFEAPQMQLRYEVQARLGKRKAVTAPFAIVAPPVELLPAKGGPPSSEPLVLRAAGGASLTVSLTERVFVFGQEFSFTVLLQAGDHHITAVDVRLMQSVCVSAGGAAAAAVTAVAVGSLDCPLPVPAGTTAPAVVTFVLTLRGGIAREFWLPSFRRGAAAVSHVLSFSLKEAGGVPVSTALPVVTTLAPPPFESAVLSHKGIRPFGFRTVPSSRSARSKHMMTL